MTVPQTLFGVRGTVYRVPFGWFCCLRAGSVGQRRLLVVGCGELFAHIVGVYREFLHFA